jgi:hypothetical protein
VALGAGAALLLFGAGYATGSAVTLSRLSVQDRHSSHRHDSDAGDGTLPAPPPPARPARSSTALHPPDMENATASMDTLIQIQEQWAPHHKPIPCEFAGHATASTSGFYDTGEPGAAFDRNPATAWRSNASTGAWVQVDLGRNYTLTAMVLDWAWDTRFGRNAKSTVATSLNGEQWNYLHSVINEPKDNNVPRRVWFPQRVARYVRFSGTEWHGGWAHMRSFELYGPECPLPPANAASDHNDIEF